MDIEEKLDAIHTDVGEIKETVAKSTVKVEKLEEWQSEHKQEHIQIWNRVWGAVVGALAAVLGALWSLFRGEGG